MELRRLFEPIRINDVEIPNRICRPGHGTAFAVGSHVTDDLIAYHVARARAGVGLIYLDLATVHPSSFNFTLHSWDDRIIEGYDRFARAIHACGAKVFHQLWHGGAHWPPADGGPPWSSSPLAAPFTGVVPVEMDHGQIEEIVQAFARATWRAEQGGIHGVEIHAGHGYLPHQFLSPLTNRRADEYGGSFDNRLRFLRQVLTAARVAVSARYPIGIRISDQNAPGGLSVEECAEAVRRLEADGLIDFVNASQGSYYSIPSMLPSMSDPVGSMLPSSAPIAAAATRVPRIVCGRLRTLEDGEQVLREGIADLVGFVRPLIADPELIRKSRSGRVEQVRPCIGCNQGCVAGILGVTHRMGCVVNPAVGFEATLAEELISRTDEPKKVLVVGGGPAGMEAARTAALRGHRVTLCEASASLGGALRVARLAPKLQGIYDIADWLEREVYRLGVTIRTGTYVEASDVMREAPDAVIVATGAVPRTDGVLISVPGEPAVGIEQPHVLSSVELLTDPDRNLGSSALVFDDLGQYEAVGVAEYLLERGLAVTFATRCPSFAPAVDMAVRAEPALERLHAKGSFELVTRAHLVAVERGHCVIRPIHGRGTRRVPADTVVMVAGKSSLNELARELAGRVPALSLVGDSLSPRDLQCAIREGHLAGRRIS
ncbi:MAG TPA: FAD-dependent oxidoreductase [Steroidobacteraceae bacterium]|nr:FAD-dependent oxidoreductase [Steroidobacteraceae bacterium]